MIRFAALFVLFFSALTPAVAAERPVTVFAAASLSGALDEIAVGYDGEVRLSFGGSGTMARQVAAGAPADVVVLANTLWMDWLMQQGVLTSEQPVTVAQNTLVLVGPADAKPMAAIADLPDRLGADRLAMGQRDAVPAGNYARHWLESQGLWERLHPRLAETDNVRAALALVARGEVPMGIVYASDAVAEPRVKVLWSVEPKQTDPILYPAAAVTKEGAAFLAFLTTSQAQAILLKRGFRAGPDDR